MWVYLYRFEKLCDVYFSVNELKIEFHEFETNILCCKMVCVEVSRVASGWYFVNKSRPRSVKNPAAGGLSSSGVFKWTTRNARLNACSHSRISQLIQYFSPNLIRTEWSDDIQLLLDGVCDRYGSLAITDGDFFRLRSRSHATATALMSYRIKSIPY